MTKAVNARPASAPRDALRQAFAEDSLLVTFEDDLIGAIHRNAQVVASQTQVLQFSHSGCGLVPIREHRDDVLVLVFLARHGGGLGPSLKLVDDRLQFRSDRCAVLDEERSNRLSTGGCDGKDRALVVGIGAPVAAVRPRYRNLGRIELLA